MAALQKTKKDPTLNKFNQTISDINKFERIRYPEEMFRLGMLAEIGPARNMFPQSPGAKWPTGERYQLAFDEVDELVKLIFQIERINPEFYVGSLHEDAKRYLNYRNKWSL